MFPQVRNRPLNRSFTLQKIAAGMFLSLRIVANRAGSGFAVAHSEIIEIVRAAVDKRDDVVNIVGIHVAAVAAQIALAAGLTPRCLSQSAPLFLFQFSEP